MKMPKSLLPVSAALLALLSFPAFADPGKVVIGLIEDMFGLYADINGPGGVEAIKMAIADFGGSVLGQPIELFTADHQKARPRRAEVPRMGRARQADHGARRRQYRR